MTSLFFSISKCVQFTARTTGGAVLFWGDPAIAAVTSLIDKLFIYKPELFACTSVSYNTQNSFPCTNMIKKIPSVAIVMDRQHFEDVLQSDPRLLLDIVSTQFFCFFVGGVVNGGAVDKFKEVAC